MGRLESRDCRASRTGWISAGRHETDSGEVTAVVTLVRRRFEASTPRFLPRFGCRDLHLIGLPTGDGVAVAVAAISLCPWRARC